MQVDVCYVFFFQSVGGLYWPFFVCKVEVSKAHLFPQKYVMNFFLKHSYLFFLHIQPFSLSVRMDCWSQSSKIQLHFRMVMVMMIVQQGVLHIVEKALYFQSCRELSKFIVYKSFCELFFETEFQIWADSTRIFCNFAKVSYF